MKTYVVTLDHYNKNNQLMVLRVEADSFAVDGSVLRFVKQEETIPPTRPEVLLTLNFDKVISIEPVRMQNAQANHS